MNFGKLNSHKAKSYSFHNVKPKQIDLILRACTSLVPVLTWFQLLTNCEYQDFQSRGERTVQGVLYSNGSQSAVSRPLAAASLADMFEMQISDSHSGPPESDDLTHIPGSYPLLLVHLANQLPYLSLTNAFQWLFPSF